MLFRLFLLFTIVPMVELYLLIKVGQLIGAFNTILLVLVTAFLGAMLAHVEGLRTMRQIGQNLSQGIIPAEELVDGVLIFLAGVLLITPGVLTDLLGIYLLIPLLRTHFKRWLRKRFERMVASGSVRLHFRSGQRDDF